MKTADDWFDQYGQSHQNPLNKKIHWVCIPAIMVSALGLLHSIPIGTDAWYFSPATVALAFAVGYYSLISRTLALGMAFVGAACFAAALGLQVLPMPLWLSSILVFVVAWIAQFVGHKIEGKKPSFLEDLQFLLIGPLWLLGFIYRRLGIPYA